MEDNDLKAAEIIEVIEALRPDEVLHAKSLRATYPLLERGGWDIVILDMTLHAAEGHWANSSKESLAGLEVLQAIAAQRDACRVIVATQHSQFRQDPLSFSSIEALETGLATWFPETYAGIVQVRLGRSQWKADLKKLLIQAGAKAKRPSR